MAVQTISRAARAYHQGPRILGGQPETQVRAAQQLVAHHVPTADLGLGRRGRVGFYLARRQHHAGGLGQRTIRIVAVQNAVGNGPIAIGKRVRDMV